MWPVGLECALKRDQIQCGRRVRVRASLENEQIQEQEDIEDTEHDTADHKTLAETLSDMRRVPFLMREKTDQDRYGNASDPHQDDPEPPLVVHVRKKIVHAELQAVDDEYRGIENESSRLKKRAQKVALRKQEHQVGHAHRHEKQEYFLHGREKLFTESDTQRMQKHTQYETDGQYRGVCLVQPGLPAVISCRRSLAHSVYSPQVSDSGA